MVQWDHRGAGKTLRRTGKADSGPMTFDQRVADAIEVIEFLRRHLGADKVVVLAESMGPGRVEHQHGVAVPHQPAHAQPGPPVAVPLGLDLPDLHPCGTSGPC